MDHETINLLELIKDNLPLFPLVQPYSLTDPNNERTPPLGRHQTYDIITYQDVPYQVENTPTQTQSASASLIAYTGSNHCEGIVLRVRKTEETESVHRVSDALMDLLFGLEEEVLQREEMIEVGRQIRGTIWKE
jgi:hypothetical protein